MLREVRLRASIYGDRSAHDRRQERATDRAVRMGREELTQLSFREGDSGIRAAATVDTPRRCCSQARAAVSPKEAVLRRLQAGGHSLLRPSSVSARCPGGRRARPGCHYVFRRARTRPHPPQDVPTKIGFRNFNDSMTSITSSEERGTE